MTMDAVIHHSPEDPSLARINESIRSLSEGEQYLRAIAPRFHRLGWQKAMLPERLHAAIIHRFFENRYVHSCLTSEETHGIVRGSGQAPSLVAGGSDFGDLFYGSVHLDAELIGILEAFAGCALEPTFWYGPRLYLEGSVMERHIDRPLTHLISATIMVDGRLDEPWPIFADTDEETIEVHLSPGEMLLYEGVRLPHYRPHPLRGEYVGLFLHYKPRGLELDVAYLDAVSSLAHDSERRA